MASLLVSLLSITPHARAGTYTWLQTNPNTNETTYSPIYSGGTTTGFSTTTGDHNAGSPYLMDFRPSPPTYEGGTAELCAPDAYGNAATFTESGSGSLSAKFTWQPAFAGDPAPSTVIIQETCTVVMRWSCSGGATLTGSDSTSLGQSGTIGGSSGSNVTISGTRYSVVTPGADGSVSTPGADGSGSIPACSPSAIQSGNSGTAGIAQASFTITYTATATPVTISLGGTMPDASGNQNILVGQGCTATLSTFPFTPSVMPTYAWRMTGTPFHVWSPMTPANPLANPPTPANPNASYYAGVSGTLSNPTAHWYWNDPKNATETVSCTVKLTPPAGQGSAFSVSATKNVAVVVPTVAVHTNSVGVGYIASVQSNNQTVTGMVAAPTQLMLNNLQDYGSTWTISVSLPTMPNFGVGQWGYAQLITPGEYLTDSNGVQTPSTDTTRGEGLDASFPYVVSNTDSGLQPTDGNSYHEGDSPNLVGFNASVASAKLTDSFRTYLMFKPPGSDVMWVPLAESLWGTNFNASIPASGSWLDFPASQSVGPVSLGYDFVLQNGFPKWSRIVLSGQPFLHN